MLQIKNYPQRIHKDPTSYSRVSWHVLGTWVRSLPNTGCVKSIPWSPELPSSVRMGTSNTQTHEMVGIVCRFSRSRLKRCWP